MNKILILVWLHFLGDFLLQTTEMATNKYNSIKHLALHSFVYSLPFLLIGLQFAVINMILHFIIDFFTSKVTHELWEKEESHWFFVVIGFDQAVHITCLIITSNMLFIFN